MIRIRQIVVDEMHAHGRRGFPHEVVGGLLGANDQFTKTVSFENENETLPERRYQASAQQVMKAERDAMKEDLGVLGFYHTHPNHPALPSGTDVEHCVPGYLYAILSVLEGEPDALTLWILSPEGDEMLPVSYEIV